MMIQRRTFGTIPIPLKVDLAMITVFLTLHGAHLNVYVKLNFAFQAAFNHGLQKQYKEIC